MVEAKGRSALVVQGAPIGERGIEQPESSNDIGLDELRGPVDRPVDVRFRG
jgi:hypothetical protein